MTLKNQKIKKKLKWLCIILVIVAMCVAVEYFINGNLDLNRLSWLGVAVVTTILGVGLKEVFNSNPDSVRGDVINADSVVHIHGNVTIHDKQYVIQSARKLQQTEVNTERFKRAREYFEKGEFKLANEVLDEQKLSEEQAALLKEKEKEESDKSDKKLQDNAAEFIFKAKLTAMDYSLKTERIPQAEALFEKALISERSASNLFEFGLFLQENNQFSKANKVYQEALALYRGLAEQNRTVYLPDVAMTLNNLATLVSDDSSRRQEAEEYCQEAIAIYRTLVQQSPSQYSPDLARILIVTSFLKLELKEYEQAKQLLEEAESLIRPYTEQQPNIWGEFIEIIRELKTLLE